MGTCSSLIRPNPNAQLMITISQKYPRETIIAVKVQDDLTEDSKPEALQIILTEPCQIHSELLKLPTNHMWVTQCTLPGIDPRGLLFKKCQDTSIILKSHHSSLFALFDGHGPDGEKVVIFCSAYTEKYYNSYNSSKSDLNYFENPEIFLKSLTESCDTELLNNLRIDTSYSGW